MRGDRSEAGVGEESAHGGTLVESVLDQQPTARREVRAGTSGDEAEIIEAVGAGDQRRARFEAQVAGVEVRIARGDVGRVRKHEVEAAPGKRRPPRAFGEIDIAKTTPLGVRARDGECRDAGLGREYPCPRSRRGAGSCRPG